MSNKQDVIKELKNRVSKDQKERTRIFAKGYEPNSVDWELLEKIDKDNSAYIKYIIKEHGFISISKFGKKASFNAWLIVQHADHDFSLMKDYLKLMEENKGDLDIKNYAYLKDRVLTMQGKKQIYGTQFKKDEKTNQFKPFPIKDPNKVDKLREELGLESLEEYRNSFS